MSKLDLDKEDTVTTEVVEEVVDWKAKAEAAEAEAAKQKAIKKEIQKERDELKKSVKPVDNPEVTKYLKEELESVSSKLTKYAEKAKNASIKVAASSKLSAMGINPDALDLAVQQLDKSLIQYDEDTDSVDDTALSAAVSKLKSKHPFLFERTVSSPKFRPAAEGSAKGDDKTISPEEWRSMSSKEQRIAIKAGRRVS